MGRLSTRFGAAVGADVMLYVARIAQPRHAVESELGPSVLPARKHI